MDGLKYLCVLRIPYNIIHSLIDILIAPCHRRTVLQTIRPSRVRFTTAAAATPNRYAVVVLVVVAYTLRTTRLVYHYHPSPPTECQAVRVA